MYSSLLHRKAVAPTMLPLVAALLGFRVPACRSHRIDLGLPGIPRSAGHKGSGARTGRTRGQGIIKNAHYRLERSFLPG